MRRALTCLLLSAATYAASAAPGASAQQLTADQVFARVGEDVITVGHYATALRAGVRKKYYHGQIPASEFAAFQREVADQLIERTLMLAEARRLGIVPDESRVARRLAVLEQRAARHPEWETHREQMRARFRAVLDDESRVEQLEARIRDIREPDDAALRAYYDAHPEKFTEPERFRVHAILLKVDPSASQATWHAAREEATALVARIRAGASFEELARLHSGDASAARGGDMGYLHRGMLGDPAQQVVDEAALGAVSDPVRLLEGVAIFRVDERIPAQLSAFTGVRERARGLWIREERESTRQALLQRLREAVEIRIETPVHLLSAGHDAASQ